MSTIRRADYIGFTFNGFHSSELGIVRVSNGSRFDESLLPTIQDKTVQIPGRDGMYLFGSYYTQKQFNISYAFDTLTEEQLAQIKRVFGDKKIHDLTFDEAPYKTYQAKATGSASIKYIPFSEGEKNRVYKGEGTIQFTAYNPFAICKHKYLNDKYYEDFGNKEEWKGAAGLLPENNGKFDTNNGSNVWLYNPGDKETDFVLTLNFNNDGIIKAGYIRINEDALELQELKSLRNDDSVRINSKLNLIEGYKNGRKTGNIYNKYIINGDFFKIPVSRKMDPPLALDFSNSNLREAFAGIEYNYIYF